MDLYKMTKNTLNASTLAATDTVGDNVPNPKAGIEVAVPYGNKDITHGYLVEGMLAYTDDTVLMYQGGNDLRTYTEVLRDEQVKAAFEQRRSAVVACEYIVEPGGTRAIDKAAAEFAKNQLDKIGFDRVTDRMLFGVFYGFMAAEVIYEPGQKFLEWKSIKVRNPRRFGFMPDGSLRLRTLDGGQLGDEAPAPYFWVVSSGSEYDDQPYGKGLAHWCYWPVKFKRNGIKYWMIHAEKFGTPTAVASIPPGLTDNDRNASLNAAAAVSTQSSVVVPNTVALSLLEAQRSGPAEYAALCEYMDGAISKAIVGQTMTTDNGSSKSQGEVHYTVRQDIVRSDANLICDSFNQGPMAWLISVNFPTAALPRVRRVIEEAEDLNVLATREQRLVSIGYRPSQDRVDETYGLGYEKIESPDATPPVVEQEPGSPGAPASGTRAA